MGRMLLVKRDPYYVKTRGGIHLPSMSTEPQAVGTVLKAGPGSHNRAGKLTPMEIHAGDRIAFRKYARFGIEFDDIDLVMLDEADVFVKLQGADGEKEKADP